MPTRPRRRRSPDRVRDSRRQKQYDAEGVLPANTSAAAKRYLVDGEKVGSTGNVSVKACQAYVDHVTASAWFQRRWGGRRIPVGHKVSGNATWDGYDISLPPWSRDEQTILHEIAHALVPRYVRDSDLRPAAHGPEFAAILLTLVRYQMGEAHARALRASYVQHRVRYRTGMWAVPEPDMSRTIVTASQQRTAEVAARRREKERARARVTSHAEVSRTAAHLRALVEVGAFGTGQHPTRKAARAVIKSLEAQQ